MKNNKLNPALLNTASNLCDEDRQSVDYYATHPSTVDLALYRFKSDGIELPEVILEPFCGGGNISKMLENYGHKVISQDLYDHGYGEVGIDFFKETSKYDCIFSNPPYLNILDYLKHGVNRLNDGGLLIYLMKIQVLETEKRMDFWKESGLKYIYAHAHRQECGKNNIFTGSSAAFYCWFVIQKGFKGEPVFRYI